MQVSVRVVRPPGWRIRRGASFALSAGLHGATLGWLVFGPPLEPPAKTLYQQVIEPNRERIIWYNLRDRLPEVAPAKPDGGQRPRQPRQLAKQTLLSDAPEKRNVDQMIFLPDAPETATPLPSPNVVAVRETAPPRRSALPDAPQVTSTSLAPAPIAPDVARPRPRDFVPPSPTPLRRAPSTLPDAPQVTSTSLAPSPIAPDVARPRPRDFVAPTPTPSRRTPSTLPDAPQVTSTSLTPSPVAPDVARPRPRDFVPPTPTPSRRAPSPLPDAPQLTSTSLAPSPITPDVARPRPRDFVLPTPTPSRRTPSTLPDAPQVASTSLSPSPVASDVARPRPRDFVPPSPPPWRRDPTMLPDAPQVASTSLSPSPIAPHVARPRPRDFVPSPPAPATSVAAVIVSPNPALNVDVPDPAAALRAGFSTGPQPGRRNTGDAAEPGARLNVPGLTVRGGPRETSPTLVARVLEAPTSAYNLAAASRTAPRAVAPDEAAASKSVRVSAAPDPRLEGRIVYTIAVQMPNITSYSGSWIFWFAEREAQPRASPDIHPPAPLRKVDPKYFADAVDARREGKVRLAAVIRRTGRIDTVTLISGFDARLDGSAAEALAKWEFEPARRNGTPVDVDAVVEIPFRLAPKIIK